MTTATLPLARPAPRVRGAVVAGALTAVCALAALLRLADFGRVYTTPYYDAAVRSMGLSWHNFLYGALDPSGRVAIDKAPLDLWLQVATTKLLGFSSVSLRLPPAIAGTLSVLLLFDLVRRGFGPWAGLAAGLALAVLPVAVLTSRSDTMDAVMSLLLVLAAWLVVRVPIRRRAWAVVGAGAVAGLAFEVKLFEAAVALPALALLAWLALDGRASRRAGILLLAALAYLAAAAAWPVTASLLPGPHPWPLGSTDGQIWNSILVYDGLHRFGAGASTATAPGPLRLFRAGPPREFGALIGVELAVALLAGALAALTAQLAPAMGDDDDARRRRSAVGWGLGVWLVTGLLVASFMARQWPRYLEAFTPAVAGVLGIGLAELGRAAARRRLALPALAACAAGAAAAGLIAGTHVRIADPRLAGAAARRAGLDPAAALRVAVLAAAAALVLVLLAALSRRRKALAAAAVAAIATAALAVPLATALDVVRSGAGDSAAAGTMPTATLDALRTYLRAHRAGARYELAGASILKETALIVRDAQPVVTLTGPGGRQLVTPDQLLRLARSGQLRYALLGATKCTPAGRGSGCAPVVRFVRDTATDVSLRAGLPHRGILYRL